MVEKFGHWDYVVFTLMLVISIAIGIFYGCRGGSQRTTMEFLMANHSMGIIPVSISILVSFMSAILIIGTPAEVYINGPIFYLYMFGMIFGIIIAAIVFVPLLFPLKLTSSFEYLERRFKSKPAKLTGTVIMIIQQVIYMGIASYAPSTSLETATGIPFWASIICAGAISTFYTTMGGMKAVIWTDVFQAAIMFAGVLAIFIQGVLKVGGFENMWKENKKWGRTEFFNFSPDPAESYTFWALIFGGMVTWIATFGCSQASVQRYSTLTSIHSARKSIILNIIGVVILVTVLCLCGVVLFAYYAIKQCDPLVAKEIDNKNKLIPYFVMDIFTHPGLPGLFISCLFSAALSTMSSCLNSLAAVTWEDFLKPYVGERLTESQKIWVTKGLVIIFGTSSIGIGFLAEKLGGTVLELTIRFNSATYGPILGLFLLGGLFPWANGIGAVVGGIFGFALPVWMTFGEYKLPKRPHSPPFHSNNCTTENINATTLATNAATLTAFIMNTSGVDSPSNIVITGIDKFYSVSLMWYAIIGATTTCVVGLIVSFITGPMSVDEVDPKYLIPLFDRLCCCLPATWRRVLRCNRDFPSPEKIKQEERDVEIIYPENSDFGSPPPEKSNLESIESLDSGIESASVNSMYYEMFTITTHL